VSHVVEIQTEVRDPAAIRAGCERLKLPEPEFGEVKLFSSTVTGWAVQLPQWRYPIVCDVENATIAFDSFEGRWGSHKHLSAFTQAYAIERAKLAARRRGHTVVEQPLEGGSVKLTVTVGGAA
jgi:hypothetical protein